MKYERPYTLDQIRQKYGQEVYDNLKNDPVHKWRADTGIELIHKEPTREEFEWIVKNWNLMTPEQKAQSDQKSEEIFGNNNRNRIDLLRTEYDFNVGDRVKVRKGLRCFQSGHTGEIIRIDPPNQYGWNSFIVKFDEPRLGTMGFYSGDLEKIAKTSSNESNILDERFDRTKDTYFCNDCGFDISNGSADQYVMIDDALWKQVCNTGNKKSNDKKLLSTDILCRDCIEKRLRRKLTLKDLGMYKNFPINKDFKKTLAKESVVLEGKHWPEDYVKTAKNNILNSALGKAPWYSENFIDDDLKTIVHEFGPLSHKNSNLGYFAIIIKWFIEFAGNNKQKYQEFIERKLDGIIRTLLWLSNNPGEESKVKDQLKTKWTFNDFEKFQKSVEDKIKADQEEKTKNLKLVDKGYEIVPIRSYEQLHDKFGGDITGYHGRSMWCHTNGKSTYESWTDNGIYNFFILAKKGWEDIEPPDPSTTNAYDEYGTSLIAILVVVATTELRNATLRWNHIIEPSETKPGTSVDKAFLGWGDLAEVTGRDIKSEIEKFTQEEREKYKKAIERANKRVKDILNRPPNTMADGEEGNVFTMYSLPNYYQNKITELKIPEKYKVIDQLAFANNRYRNLKTVELPNTIEEIDTGAFSDFQSLTSLTIPEKVISIPPSFAYNCMGLIEINLPSNLESICEYAFERCQNLTSINIPDSVILIKHEAFYGSGITSIKFPPSMTYIAGDTFGESKLKSLDIPGNIIEIGYGAFARCTDLTSVIMRYGVSNIKGSAFSYCKNLKTVIVPSSVESIASFAFKNCSEDLKVYFEGRTMDEVLKMKGTTPWTDYGTFEEDNRLIVPDPDGELAEQITGESIKSNLTEADGNSTFVRVNPNPPTRQNIGNNDCGIRAISLAIGMPYVTVARKLGIWNYDIRNVDPDFTGLTWDMILKFFKKMKITDPYLGKFKDMTVKEFAKTISRRKDFKDKYFIVGCMTYFNGEWYGHCVFVKNGRYYDIFDSGNFKIMYIIDVTDERNEKSYDFRNMVQIRRNSKKRY